MSISLLRTTGIPHTPVRLQSLSRIWDVPKRNRIRALGRVLSGPSYYVALQAHSDLHVGGSPHYGPFLGVHIKGGIDIDADVDTDSSIWVVVNIMVPFWGP